MRVAMTLAGLVFIAAGAAAQEPVNIRPETPEITVETPQG